MSGTGKRIPGVKKKQAKIVKRLESLLVRIIKGQQSDIRAAKNINILTAIVSSNIFTRTSTSNEMQEFYNYIAQAFQDGIKYGGGSTSAQTKLLSEIITDNVAGFTTKLGNDIKADALKIIDNGIKSSSSASDIAFQLESQLEMTAARARAIARTETMRSSNTASYVQAKANGMTHYTVDYADDACDECVELYQDEVFSIDDQENIPPVHPNCRCVPVYFNDKDEAKEWSDMITEDVNNANETREASKEE